MGTNITPIGIFCPKVGTAGTGGWGRLERKIQFFTRDPPYIRKERGELMSRLEEREKLVKKEKIV